MPIVAAFVWGFAEATLFFIVADVFLSFMVVWRGWRVALVLAWSAYDTAGLLAVLKRLPSIDAAMIESAGTALAGDWFSAILAGAFSGVPYKVFAAQVWPAGISTLAFLAATVPLRLARYFTVTACAAGIDFVLGKWLGRPVRITILCGAWVLFYTIFWSTFPR